jgi:hypothetical protein
LEIRALGPNVALVTYRSELLSDGDPALAHRSSIWTLLDDNWQLRFHQGTPTTP